MEELQHLVNRHRARGDLRVEELHLLVDIAVGRRDPLDGVDAALAVGEVLGGELTGEDLEDDDAEAVDVGLVGDALVLEEVGGLEGEHGLDGVGGVHEGLEGVVAEDRVVVVGQEDVAGLEVAVGEVVGGEFRVEETKTPGDSLDYLQTGWPVQLRVTTSAIACRKYLWQEDI